jgi:hypothetical protein
MFEELLIQLSNIELLTIFLLSRFSLVRKQRKHSLIYGLFKTNNCTTFDVLNRILITQWYQ